VRRTAIRGEEELTDLGADPVYARQRTAFETQLRDILGRLEAETHRNIEVIWLLRHLKPDFKTIADFRRDKPR
jgi:hypothetical protein